MTMKTKVILFGVSALAFAGAIFSAVYFEWSLFVASSVLGLLYTLAGVVVDAEDDRRTVCAWVRIMRKLGLRKLAYKYANMGK